MGWLENLVDHLKTSLSLTSDIFFETFDSTAPDCICFIHHPGIGNEQEAGTNTLHKAEFGIRIRNQDMETAENQAKTLSDYLKLKSSFWADTTWFKRITNDNGFYHASTDAINGTIYSLNCYAEYEE
ncbi:MAG: minor capsid protein [Prevotella sp.]|jgi:hypothetical protein